MQNIRKVIDALEAHYNTRRESKTDPVIAIRIDQENGLPTFVRIETLHSVTHWAIEQRPDGPALQPIHHIAKGF